MNSSAAISLVVLPRATLEDAFLGHGQIVQAGLVRGERFGAAAAAQEKIRERRADVGFIARDGGDAIENFLGGVFLEHIAVNAEVERLVEGLLVFQHREDDDADAKFFGAQRGGDFEAGQAREIDVEHGHVGAEFGNAVESGLAMIGLAHHFKTRVATYGLAKALSKKRVIVDDHHANFTLSDHNHHLAKRRSKGEGEVCYVLDELTDAGGMLSATGTSMATWVPLPGAL